ncbi:MAG: IS66 family transposase [Candidatus Thiodiazotropha sp.]
MQDRHQQQISLLMEQIRQLRHALYGVKSEKLSAETTMRQLPLFDLPEPEELEPEPVVVPAHARKKPGRKALPKDLPRVEVVHDLADEEKVCSCGHELSRIGEEVLEQLDILPAVIRVLRHVRPKYACRQCEGVEDEGPTVRIAPVVPQVIPKSMASPGLLAHVLTAKFVDHLPFYRQEKMFRRLGVDIGRSTMGNWAMKTAEACQPLLNLLKDEVLDGRLINIDETTVQVLDEPGRRPTTKSYMWIFRRGDPERPVLVYQYAPTKAFLDDFQGFVQTDGYGGYDFVDHLPGVRHVGCMAHARRKFQEVITAQGKNRKRGSADQALAYIGKLYRLESDARAARLDPDQILSMRQNQVKPLLQEFHGWLLKRSFQTPPKGALGKAISYTLKQWPRLTGYLEDGIVTPDNNAAENAIRPFVVGRKNWLFSGTPQGAEASALLYSLIETAKTNGHEPYSYLRHVFQQLPLVTTVDGYRALLPWNLDPTTLARRVLGVVE